MVEVQSKSTLQYKMKLNIGDWSDDGHGKCRTEIYSVNKPVYEVQQAYKDSCKLTGVQFNHNENYTGLPERCGYHNDPTRICTEYEDSQLHPDAREILLKFGLPDKFFDPYEGEYYVADFEGLWWWFVSLSLTDLEYKEAKDEVPNINGYWDKNLNAGFGYGLFC